MATPSNCSIDSAALDELIRSTLRSTRPQPSQPPSPSSITDTSPALPPASTSHSTYSTDAPTAQQPKASVLRPSPSTLCDSTTPPPLPAPSAQGSDDSGEIIDLVDSSTDDEGLGFPTTARKMYNVIGSDSSDDDSAAENTSTSYVPAPALPSQHTTLFTPPPFRPNNSRPQPWEPLTSNRDNDEYPALRPSLPLALQTPTNFKKERDALARKLLCEYNARVFGGRLPDDLEIKWNARLATTAGITHYKRTWAPGANLPLYTAHIELSSKVIDTESKLGRTLCHEMCHVAAWLIDHVAKPPHGPVFKKWAAAGMAAYPHLDITTCHAYEIFYAFRWQCGGCSQVYGRHSNSIDVGKKVCGQCRGMLQFMGKFKPDGSVVKSRQPTAFSAFIKENYKAEQAKAPGTQMSEVMKILSKKWSEQQPKLSARAGTGSGGDGSAEPSSSSVGTNSEDSIVIDLTRLAL